MLGDLSAQYESNGNPGCISDGYGDPGGKSYGTYQFSSNAGSLNQFVNYIQRCSLISVPTVCILMYPWIIFIPIIYSKTHVTDKQHLTAS